MKPGDPATRAGVPLGERAGVGEHADPLRQRDPQVPVAALADPAGAQQPRAVERAPALRALDPGAGRHGVEVLAQPGPGTTGRPVAVRDRGPGPVSHGALLPDGYAVGGLESYVRARGNCGGFALRAQTLGQPCPNHQPTPPMQTTHAFPGNSRPRTDAVSGSGRLNYAEGQQPGREQSHRRGTDHPPARHSGQSDDHRWPFPAAGTGRNFRNWGTFPNGAPAITCIPSVCHCEWSEKASHPESSPGYEE